MKAEPVMAPGIHFPLHERQMRAMQCIWEDGAAQLMYGGAAGGGKSELIRALAYHCAMIWPGARIPIFRLTYPDLLETHVEAWLIRMAELGWDNSKSWEATSKQYRFPNGSIVEFRHIDQSLGAKKWLSAEWACILVDEAGQFKSEDLRLLYSRVRRPREGRSKDWQNWRPLAVYCSNPGGPSHTYLKETFIDPAVDLAVGEVLGRQDSRPGHLRYHQPVLSPLPARRQPFHRRSRIRSRTR